MTEYLRQANDGFSATLCRQNGDMPIVAITDNYAIAGAYSEFDNKYHPQVLSKNMFDENYKPHKMQVWFSQGTDYETLLNGACAIYGNIHVPAKMYTADEYMRGQIPDNFLTELDMIDRMAALDSEILAGIMASR